MAGRYKGYKANKDEVATTEEDSLVTKRGRGRPTTQETTMRNVMIDMFLEGLNTTVQKRIDETVMTASSALMDEIDEKLARLENNRVIQIQHKDTVRELEEQTHAMFPTFVQAMTTGIPVMLVGPAGTGKTYAALQIARLFEVPFYSMSVGVQTSKSDIGGYMSAVGDYVRSQFREAYEHGGVFLMDEIDAGNSNVLIFINAALSSDYCAFPDGMIKKHEKFYFVGTGNTYGTGASRQYVGRNQLDAATLDRFIVIDWPIDTGLEASLVAHLTHGKKWMTVIEQVRDAAEKSEYRLIISPRATIKGALLLEAGMDFDSVLQSTVLAQATRDQQKILAERAKTTWSRGGRY